MKRDIDILTTDECHSLLSACSKAPTGIRNRAMVVVLWRACLRIKEALSLLPKDVTQESIRVHSGKGGRPAKRPSVRYGSSLGSLLKETLHRRATSSGEKMQGSLSSLFGRMTPLVGHAEMYFSLTHQLKKGPILARTPSIVLRFQPHLRNQLSIMEVLISWHCLPLKLMHSC